MNLDFVFKWLRLVEHSDIIRGSGALFRRVPSTLRDMGQNFTCPVLRSALSIGHIPTTVHTAGVEMAACKHGY